MGWMRERWREGDCGGIEGDCGIEEVERVIVGLRRETGEIMRYEERRGEIMR